MARDILSQYGPDSANPQKARATKGGITIEGKRDVMNYKPPQGPTNIMDPCGPGLHGKNYGNVNCPTGAGGEAGRPGLGGENRGNRNRP